MDAVLSLKEHLVICGWKLDIGLIIHEILEAEPKWRKTGLLIVANVTEKDASDLMSDPGLSGVQLIRDEAFHESALKKACIGEAAKVMVLADWSDKDMTATETDAKTVMTMMAIEKLAPHVYTIAEILDPGYAVYLKMTHVDELIFPREYSRLLLAGASASAGIAHVIYDLLTVDAAKPCVLTTVAAPPEYVGRTFRELCAHFDALASPRSICVGLLENTGNIHALKHRAKIEAQKTREIRDILVNLQQVKEIKPNLPKLNPGDEYEIRPYSMAVVIETPDETTRESGLK